MLIPLEEDGVAIDIQAAPPPFMGVKDEPTINIRLRLNGNEIGDARAQAALAAVCERILGTYAGMDVTGKPLIWTLGKPTMLVADWLARTRGRGVLWLYARSAAE